jgi:predicted dehydrogenase
MKRILLMGLGRWGANHLRVLKSMPVELFVADHGEKRMNSADVPETRRSKDSRSLFSKVDAVVVVTPAQGENRHVRDNGEIKAEEGMEHQLEFPPEEPLRAELAAFIDAIEKRAPSPVDGWAGFHAVRVVEAALDSARTGKWIDISQ